jgi:hypothetical protein
VGSVAEYLKDPTFVASAVREGRDIADVQVGGTFSA